MILEILNLVALALGVPDGYTGTPSPGPAVSGRHLRCAAIWCGTSSIRQLTPTCAMVMARSTVQAAGTNR